MFGFFTENKNPTRPPFKRSQSLVVCDQDIKPLNLKGHISHLYMSTTGDIWASNDRGTVGLIDRSGNNKRSIETCSTYSGHFAPVTVDDKKEHIYWVHNEKKFVKRDDKNESETGTYKWIPISIIFSAEEILFYVGKVKDNDAKITRYNKDWDKQDDIHKHICIENGKNENLFQYPAYLAKNINGDLCVSDNNQCVIVVNDKKLRFKYTGFDQDGFTPYGICTDSEGQILVVDSSSRSIHIITQEGKFERKIKMLDYLREPRGLCIDKSGNCYVGSFGTILVYKYTTTTESEK